jgi:D-amino peptidase
MMKVFISVDIEGVNGNFHWDETILDKPGYEIFRQQMTAETVACCKALIDKGITDIYVRDAHDSARNLNHLDLPKEVKLIRGWTGSICDMMAYLNESFDAAIMIGYHSPARSDGNPLSHTLNLSHHYIKINGQDASEFLINTYYAQTFKVPVILVSGDENLTKLVKQLNPKIETVAAKSGIHGAVISKHPDLTVQEIYDKTIKAVEKLQNEFDACQVSLPNHFEVEVCFKQHENAYQASFYPEAKLISSDTVTYSSNDYLDVLRFITFTVK